MRFFCLFLISGFSIPVIFAQTILVQPYLQDAEPTSIKVMWESDGGVNHTVDWGTTAGNLNQTVLASSITSQGANLIHEATIDGLAGNTDYYYRVSSDGVNSATYKFITPPLKSSEQSFNLIAMSDIQKDGNNPNKFAEIVSDGILPYMDSNYGSDLPANLGFVMIPGDLVVNGTNYNQWKNDFFDPAQTLFSQVPVYPVLGNHENNSVHYFNYFEHPDNGTPGFEEHWWYKDYSNLRIIGLNSNGGYRIQAQLDWLAGVLNTACSDSDIDFVFVQLHHPFKSELWTPGELDYTGDVIQLMETFTTDCGKPSIHFFGHTHGYSRGQSRDHEHLWVNVASAGGALDNWGEFPNADYEEFSKSIDEYGFVMVNVEAGANPQFTLRRISRGDATTTLENVEQDLITLKRTDHIPQEPTGIFPDGVEVNPDCVTLLGSAFTDPGDRHQASQWQVANSCNDFTDPIFDSWRQDENWYNEINTQADDVLTDELIRGLTENSSYCWRVRYRDSHLKWSEWSDPVSFTTGSSGLTSNLLTNPGGENGVTGWMITTGIIESLESGECNGIAPRSGNNYLAVGGLCDGNETPYSEVFQLLDVSSYAADIDGGLVTISFGGFLANFGGSDTPEMKLEFLDNSQSLVERSPVLTTQSSSWTELTALEEVPATTRFIKVILSGTRNAGTDNDSYFDDLQVRLDLIAEDDCSRALPVELTNIAAHCEADRTFLVWDVEKEEDILTYQIERSFDGREWLAISNQVPRNNGSEEQQYRFNNPEDNHDHTVYYRIKIIEVDQRFRYSPVVSAQCEELAPTINFFPNPITGNLLNVSIENPQQAATTIKVVNLLGQQVYYHELILTEGSQQLKIDGSNWANGIYIITVSTVNWQWSEKVIRE